MDFRYEEAFQRNAGLFRPGDLEKIRSARIGIGGLGGCGSNHLLSLARMGFERFTIADPDVFDQSNFNRQAGAFLSTVGKPKVDVMVEMVRDINPQCDFTVYPHGITPENVDQFVADSDVGVNAIDWFQVGQYTRFHDTFRANGKYSTVGASPFAFGAAMTVIGPETPSFDEVFSIEPGDDLPARLRKFAATMASKEFTAGYLEPGVNTIADPVENTRIASSAGALALCTALTVTEVLAIVTGRRRPTLAPETIQIDLMARAASPC